MIPQNQFENPAIGNASDLVDGLNTYSDEAHGLQFQAGCVCWYANVVVDWGTLHPFNRLLVWHHLTVYYPRFNVEYFDGSNWLPVGGTSSVRSDLAVNTPSQNWSIPTENVFPTVIGSKVRYSWYPCGLMETAWIWEVEVFSDTPLPPPTVYQLSGFLPPVDDLNMGKVGRTYPLKWQLQDAGGAYVSDLAAVSLNYAFLGASCSGAVSQDDPEPEAAGNTTLHYDDAANQYIFNWATPDQPGCYGLLLTLDSGQTHMAYFDLN